MKHSLRRGLATVLAVATLATSVLALDWQWQSQTQLGKTVALSAGQYVQNGNQTEYVLEVGKGDGLIPRVYYGNSLYGRSTMDTLASQLKAKGLTPVAAVNGSFFELATGMPYGVVITDGVLRASGSGTAVGFFADGSAIIGSPTMSYKVTTPDGAVMPPHVNRNLSDSNGLVLFNRDFDTTTKSTQKAYNVVLKPEKSTLKLGETTKAQVVDIVEDTANCAIPTGQWLLSMTTNTDYQYTLNTQLKTLAIGDVVTVESQVVSGWENVQFACGGDDILVENGKAKTSFHLDSAYNQTGRTAIGIKANGDVVLLAVDGLRTSYSKGMTLSQLANRMVELGCVTALNLDGGGSTTMGGRYLGTDTLETLNSPSDGSQRRCANFIFLTRQTTVPGVATQLHLYPYDQAVLAGSGFAMKTLASDWNDMATAVPEDVTYTATAGTVGINGFFTAGNQAGMATVTASSGQATGAAQVLVVTDPTDMTISVEGSGAKTVAVDSGKSANLTASAVYKGYDLVAQDHSFQWSVPETLGTIDENGLFHAVDTWENLTGNITVTAGNYRETIPVTIARKPPQGATVETFEGSALQGTTNLLAGQNANRAYVKYGNGSGKMTYDVTTQATATATLSASLDKQVLGLWVYGDDSNNSLSATFAGQDQDTNLWLTQLNFSGWKWVTAKVPEGATEMTGLYVTAHKNATASKGIIYVDQMTTITTREGDTTAPTVTVTQSGGQIKAQATDSGMGVDTVKLYVDGALVSGTTWTVPQDGKTYQVRAVAQDHFGNLASGETTVVGQVKSPFVDTAGHWAAPYIGYAYDQGYLNGSKNAAGNLEFRPEDTMTRQEFAVALMAFLDVKTAQYANVTLPYEDRDQVASWAENSVKAAYQLGIMTGAGENGALYGQPTAPITRQEAMVILARTQARGYGGAALSQFSDQNAIASWAKNDIATMAAQGVIQGSNGKLDPTGNVTRGQVAKMLQMMR